MIQQTSSTSIIRSVLKWLALVLLGIICLGISMPVWFYFSAAMRESKTRIEAAPSTGSFVETPKGEVFIQEAGQKNGEVILFTHGFAAWSETWRYPMTVLAKNGFHVIAIDMPPFGFSQRPSDLSYTKKDQAARIVGVLDTLGIEHVTLVTHSYGGGAAMETVFLHPNRFKALVLVDVALGLGEEKTFSPVISTFLAIKPLRNAVLATTLTNPGYTKKLLQSFIYDPGIANDERVRIYQKPFVLQDTTNDLGDWLEHDMFAPYKVSVSDDINAYKKIDIPTLVIWGDKDTVTPLPQGISLAKYIPTAEMVILENVGHIPQIENEKQFTSNLLEFLLKHRNNL